MGCGWEQRRGRCRGCPAVRCCRMAVPVRGGAGGVRGAAGIHGAGSGAQRAAAGRRRRPSAVRHPAEPAGRRHRDRAGGSAPRAGPARREAPPAARPRPQPRPSQVTVWEALTNARPGPPRPPPYDEELQLERCVRLRPGEGGIGGAAERRCGGGAAGRGVRGGCGHSAVPQGAAGEPAAAGGARPGGRRQRPLRARLRRLRGAAALGHGAVGARAGGARAAAAGGGRGAAAHPAPVAHRQVAARGCRSWAAPPARSGDRPASRCGAGLPSGVRGHIQSSTDSRVWPLPGAGRGLREGAWSTMGAWSEGGGVARRRGRPGLPPSPSPKFCPVPLPPLSPPPSPAARRGSPDAGRGGAVPAAPPGPFRARCGRGCGGASWTGHGVGHRAAGAGLRRGSPRGEWGGEALPGRGPNGEGREEPSRRARGGPRCPPARERFTRGERGRDPPRAARSSRQAAEPPLPCPYRRRRRGPAVPTPPAGRPRSLEPSCFAGRRCSQARPPAAAVRWGQRGLRGTGGRSRPPPVPLTALLPQAELRAGPGGRAAAACRGAGGLRTAPRRAPRAAGAAPPAHDAVAESAGRHPAGGASTAMVWGGDGDEKGRGTGWGGDGDGGRDRGRCGRRMRMGTQMGRRWQKGRDGMRIRVLMAMGMGTK